MKTVEEYYNKINELKSKLATTDSIREHNKLESQINTLVDECCNKVESEEISMPCKLPTVKVTCSIEREIYCDDIDFYSILTDYLYGYIDDLQEKVNDSAFNYEIHVYDDEMDKTLIFK